MKIKKIEIENFRSFKSDVIDLNPYTCLVGPNGAGKSTVLSALNVFFQERATSVTDISKLTDEDYFAGDTNKSIKITLTFNALCHASRQELSAYVRQDELVVSAEAVFDRVSGYGAVRHFGQRLGLEDFRVFYDKEKAGAKATELTEIYDSIKSNFTELPAARSKDDKIQALRNYEAAHNDQCVLIPSADDFYGINSTGKIAQFIQWVYVPAVKDAGEEGLEAKNTALGKLIARTVRRATNFDDDLEHLRIVTLDSYKTLLARNQNSLSELSQSLQQRLAAWSHSNVRLDLAWVPDILKAVSLQSPVAGIKTGEGNFVGSLTRMGHGLQRSYLLALLQELAASDLPNAPTLLLGCEEPELYQHPPQARHLSDVLQELTNGNNQVLVTTHSPFFVSGKGFENTRVVQGGSMQTGSKVKSLTYANLADRIRVAKDEQANKPIEGLISKIHQALQPGISEMFFSRVPILVEGLEDVAYITTEMHLAGLWSEFRQLGCHLIPVNGKDKLIQPLAIAMEFRIPVFVVFDADSDAENKYLPMHLKDNQVLIKLLDVSYEAFPAEDIILNNHAIWHTNLTAVVKADFGEYYSQLADIVRVRYPGEKRLEKHGLFIADLLAEGREKGHSSAALGLLCETILKFARSL